MNTGDMSIGRSGMTEMANCAQPSAARRTALTRLGKLEDVLASDASPEVKSACIELAIAAEGRMARG